MEYFLPKTHNNKEHVGKEIKQTHKRKDEFETFL